MTNVSQVNASISRVMNKYLTDEGYDDSVFFDSKVMISTKSIMFTMMMKQGTYETEPFKVVFPSSFLEACEEDNAVKMVCDIFKVILNQIDNLSDRDVAVATPTNSPVCKK